MLADTRYDRAVLRPPAWLVLVLLAVTLAPAPSQAQLANSSWPMFGADVGHSGVGTAAGPTSIDIKWSREWIHYVLGSAVTGPDGTVYIGVGEELCALKPEDGVPRWCEHTSGTMRRNAAAVGADGHLYVGQRDNRLWAYDKDTGQALWSYAGGFDGDVNTSPAIAPDGTVYMAVSAGSTLHAFTPNGTLKWRLPLSGTPKYVSPALDPAGNIYLGTTRGYLHSVTPGGVERWRTKIGRTIRYTSPVVSASGTVVYMGSKSGITAVSAVNGAILWEFATPGYVETTPIVGPNGNLYVGSRGYLFGHGSTFYAISPSGNVVWSFPYDGGFRGSPALASNGIIYAPVGNRLIALTTGGSLVFEWEPNTTRRVISAAVALGGDGTVYVAGEQLWALQP